MIRRHLTFANVVSVIALFLALGGGAYAINLGKGDVTTKHVKNNTLKSSDVKNEILRGEDVADDALTEADIAEETLNAPAARVTFDSTVNRTVPDTVDTGTTVIWNQETFDNANLHSGSSPNLTAPIAGIYQVSATATLNNVFASSGNNVDTAFFMWMDSADELIAYTQNFTTFAYGQQQSWSPITLNASGLVSLEKGDIVQVGVMQDSGTGVAFPLNSGDDQSNFQMVWVAPSAQTAGLEAGPHVPAPKAEPVTP